MNEYNSYVNSINKIFECLNKMKNNWTDQDNLSYIESIEEYKKVVIDSAEVFKNNNTQPQPSRLEE